MFLKDAIIDALHNKRNFTTEADCIKAINKTLSRWGMTAIVPSFYIFDGSFQYTNEMKFAVSVVIGDPKQESKSKVAYLLSEMENLRAKGDIEGGVVIFITTRLSEWGRNKCIALDHKYDYFGNEVVLPEDQYYVDEWTEDYGGLNSKRRYALFFTKGAGNRISD